MELENINSLSFLPKNNFFIRYTIKCTCLIYTNSNNKCIVTSMPHKLPFITTCVSLLFIISSRTIKNKNVLPPGTHLRRQYTFYMLTKFFQIVIQIFKKTTIFGNTQCFYWLGFAYVLPLFLLHIPYWLTNTSPTKDFAKKLLRDWKNCKTIKCSEIGWEICRVLQNWIT